MKYATYMEGEAQRLGVLSLAGDRLYPLEALGLSFATMLDLIEGETPGDRAMLLEQLKAAPAGGIPVEQVRFAAPIPRPRHDIICIGQNYVAHAMEVARFRGREYQKPDYPVYFSKRVNRCPGHGDAISAHGDITDQLDYEVELAVIIGKRCDHLRREQVFDHIFGYTVSNDVSARNIQKNHDQYYFGKSLDDAAPMGPWIVTADEIAAPPRLDLCTRVNGEIRQQSNTRDYIFDIPELIAQLSAGITLEPGDILMTGTPSGVAVGMEQPRYLKSGDVVECEIEKIGVLRNTIR